MLTKVLGKAEACLARRDPKLGDTWIVDGTTFLCSVVNRTRLVLKTGRFVDTVWVVVNNTSEHALDYSAPLQITLEQFRRFTEPAQLERSYFRLTQVRDRITRVEGRIIPIKAVKLVRDSTLHERLANVVGIDRMVQPSTKPTIRSFL